MCSQCVCGDGSACLQCSAEKKILNGQAATLSNQLRLESSSWQTMFQNGCQVFAQGSGPIPSNCGCYCAFPCWTSCSSNCQQNCMASQAYSLALCGQPQSDYYNAFTYACNVFLNSWNDPCSCCNCNSVSCLGKQAWQLFNCSAISNVKP